MSNAATQKKEFNMTPVFAMWLKTSKNKKRYLSGKTEDGKRLVGFFNSMKENPKEPDVRLYEVIEGKASKEEYTSLWVNLSKNEKKFLSGKVDGKRVIGFINKNAEADGKRPYFSVYLSDDQEAPKKAEEPKEEKFMEPDPDTALPF